MVAGQAQVSRLITERRNSVITKLCACAAPEVLHRAYLRELLIRIPRGAAVRA